MTTAAEAIAAKTPLGAALAAGVNTLSGKQTIYFTRYVRTVLPADGFVFWVRASLLAKGSAAYNQAFYNAATYNASGSTNLGANTLEVQGSLHFSSLANQDEVSSAATNTVVFTALEPVQDLDDENPNFLWIATFNGQRFAFRERHMFYQQSGMHHYRGTALYATLDSQLIDAAADLPTGNVVSNSLPLWLTLNAIAPMYPSFAVPANLPPPYIAVHVVPGSTQSLAMQPWIDPATSTSWQLTSETVRFTLYGLQNNAAIDFQNYFFDSSLDDDSGFGIMGTAMPTIQDERQTQPEMQILAQRKTFQAAISYYQQRVNDIAQKYILSAIMTLTFSPDIP